MTRNNIKNIKNAIDNLLLELGFSSNNKFNSYNYLLVK